MVSKEDVATNNGNAPQTGTENQTNTGSEVLSEPESNKANMELVDYMMSVLEGGRIEAYNLYGRLKWSYWILITLSVVLFIFGLMLLSSPLWIEKVRGASSGTTFDWFATFFPAALGIADLFALYLFDPLNRINRLMGDISQLVIILNSYHICVALRSVEIDDENRPSIGAAADHVYSLTTGTVLAIKRHFGEEYSGASRPSEKVETPKT